MKNLAFALIIGVSALAPSIVHAAPSPGIFKAAEQALLQNGFTGYERTGEIHTGHVPVVIEVVYSNGKDTVEVDVRKKDSKVVSIEQEVAFSSIPANVRKAAASSGVDLKTCGIYQKAIYLPSKRIGYEFDDCEFTMRDVDVDAKTLKVVVEKNDHTMRDRDR